MCFWIVDNIHRFMQCAPKSFTRFSILRADAGIGRISADSCTCLLPHNMAGVMQHSPAAAGPPASAGCA